MQRVKEVDQERLVKAIHDIKTWEDGSPSSFSMDIYVFFKQHFDKFGLFVGEVREENEISRGLRKLTEEFDAGNISVQKMGLVFELLRQAIVDADYRYITSNEINKHIPMFPWEIKANELAITVLKATSMRWGLDNDSFAHTREGEKLGAFAADRIIQHLSSFILDKPDQQRLLIRIKVPITEQLYREYKETLERMQHR